MNTQQKAEAIKTAAQEHADLHAAVTAAGLPPGYDEVVNAALKQALTEKIAQIYKS